MTSTEETELKIVPIGIFAMEVVITLLQISEIGILFTRQPKSACGTPKCTLHKTYQPVLSQL